MSNTTPAQPLHQLTDTDIFWSNTRQHHIERVVRNINQGGPGIRPSGIIHLDRRHVPVVWMDGQWAIDTTA